LTSPPSAPPPNPLSSYGYTNRPARPLRKWLYAGGALLGALLLWEFGSALYAARAVSNAAVLEFHQRMNQDQYDEIYGAADEGFTHAITQADWAKLLGGVHVKLGDAGATSLRNVNVNASAGKSFITTIYHTAYPRDPAAVETFTWIKKDGAVKLYGYHVQSNALTGN